MRNLFVVLIILTLAACKKSTDNSLVGLWQWTNSTGGIAVHTIYPSSNSTVTLRFYNDLSYDVIINGQIAESGKYYLLTSGNYSVIHFNKTIVVDKLFLEIDELISKIENGKLILYDNNISDGFLHSFKKK